MLFKSRRGTTKSGVGDDLSESLEIVQTTQPQPRQPLFALPVKPSTFDSAPAPSLTPEKSTPRGSPEHKQNGSFPVTSQLDK